MSAFATTCARDVIAPTSAERSAGNSRTMRRAMKRATARTIARTVCVVRVAGAPFVEVASAMGDSTGIVRTTPALPPGLATRSPTSAVMELSAACVEISLGAPPNHRIAG